MRLEILAYKCKKCGHVMYPHRTLCRKCGNVLIKEPPQDGYDAVPLARRGKIVTFTRLHTLPGDFEVPEITLGIVELEDGNKITAAIEIEEPKIGMKVEGDVRIVRHDEYNHYYGMVFTKA